MSKSKKYDYWINASKFIALAKIYNLGINFLSFVLLARILAPADFGVWGLFMTLSATIATARISLIRSAFIRFMHQTEKEEHQGLQASAFAISMFITIFLSIIFFVLAPYLASWLNAPRLDDILRLYPLLMLMNTIFSQCEMSLTASMNFRAVSYMYMITRGLFFLTIAFYWGMDLTPTTPSLALTYLVCITVATGVALKFSKSVLQLSFKNYKKRLPDLWKFGKYVFGTNLSAQLFRSADAFLTSALISPAVSALYNASNRISNLVDMPSNVLADVAFVKAAKIKSDDTKAVKSMYEKTTGAILVFSLPALIILLLFPELILRIVAGNNYVEAAPILRITAFFGFILPFLKQYGTIMDATGLPHINFRTNFLSFVLNVIFNLIGIYFFGILGAAIGTATTFLCTFLITQRILYKKFGITVVQVFVNTFHFYGVLFTMAKQYLNGMPLTKRA